ncbi:MAG: 2-oxo acid dehydrogenase subunit E2 [Chloroflexi bacterium]|nr:2-oxo acid dehydrogenase subunit E2 [Chloroflexota bacterium]
MATSILMPKLGIIMTEGTVGRWLKKAGERVEKGEPLVEIYTDKITYQMEAPQGGVVQPQVPEETTVAVGGVLGHILAAGEAAPGATPVSPEAQAVPVEAPRAVETAPSGTVETPETPAAPQEATAAAKAAPSGEGRILATPAARRLAAQEGIDLAQVPATGPQGRVVEADVQRAVEERGRASAPPTTATAPERGVRQRIPLTGARRIIAQRMVESLAKTAQLTLHTQVDARELVRAREHFLSLEERLGVRISYNDLLLKIIAHALREYPLFNSVLEGKEILVLEDINIGVAVSLEEGLFTPVVRQVDKKTLTEISQKLADLVERARAHTLTLDDLADGTFTLTNMGAFGVDTFTPILNPPQVAILGAGRIREWVGVVDGQVTSHPALHLSLTFDHRVTDGAPAAQFLRRIVELIEVPWLLML